MSKANHKNVADGTLGVATIRGCTFCLKKCGSLLFPRPCVVLDDFIILFQ